MGPRMHMRSVVGQNIIIWRMIVSSNNCTPWYSIYDIHQLLHESTARCHAQEVVTKM